MFIIHMSIVLKSRDTQPAIGRITHRLGVSVNISILFRHILYHYYSRCIETTRRYVHQSSSHVSA